jgi:two-component system, response regulator PdtaR
MNSKPNKPAATPPTPSGPLRVLIVEDETLVGLGLRTQLQKLGHTVIGQAANAAEAHALFKSDRPDLVLMDIKLDQTDGIDLARQLLAERFVAMIIVSAYSDTDLIKRATDAGVFGYLIKPVNDKALEAQIEVAVRRSAEHLLLQAQNEKLQQDLETRKLLDRAKGILIKRANLSEDDAHKRLQQESQKKRISLAELCKRIIESDELMS